MKLTNTISVETEHHLHSNNLETFEHVYLLLHGYLLDGEYMFNKIGKHLPKDSLIIAPNGPFTVPFKKGEEYLPKYAWYFYDPNKKTFYINYEPAAEYVKKVLKLYNPDSKPVTVIGYSQGGYLSPKVAEVVDEVKEVIGLACVFRTNKFTQKDIPYHQVHGNIDIAVEFSNALEEYAKMKEKGNIGKFIELDEVGHKINDEFISALKDLI